MISAALNTVTAYLFGAEGSSLKLMRRPFERSLLKDTQLGSGPVSVESDFAGILVNREEGHQKGPFT